MVRGFSSDTHEGLSEAGFSQPEQEEAKNSDCQLSNSVYRKGREDTICRKENYD